MVRSRQVNYTETAHLKFVFTPCLETCDVRIDTNVWLNVLQRATDGEGNLEVYHYDDYGVFWQYIPTQP